MIKTTHTAIAHLAINRDIDNALDELHDRALDDYADAIAPHLDALRALAIARHDIACTNTAPLDSTDDSIESALDALAYQLDHDPNSSCIRDSYDAIHAICYSYYRD